MQIFGFMNYNAYLAVGTPDEKNWRADRIIRDIINIWNYIMSENDGMDQN